MYCRRCGYPLIGLESRNCPECGRGFDPADRRSYRRRPPRARVWRWVRRIGLLLLVVALLGGGGLGGLWWGWRSEQATIERIRALGSGVAVDQIGPESLGWVLGDRLGYLRDRATLVDARMISEADMDALDFKLFGRLEGLNLLSCDLNPRILAKVGQIRTLRTLQVFSGRRDKTSLDFLSGLPRLSILSVMKWNIDAEGMRPIGALEHLKWLVLRYDAISDAGLQHLQGLGELEGLELSDNPITDAGLEHLKGLKSLRTLGLLRTRVTPAGVAELQKAIPGLHVEFH